MEHSLLSVLVLVLLVGVGTGAGDQLSPQQKVQLRNKVEWQLKTRHLDWDGQPLVGRRPVWAPVGREDLHQAEDSDDDTEEWEDGQQEEPVPPEAAWLAAQALVDRHGMQQDSADGPDTGDRHSHPQVQEQQDQKEAQREVQDPEKEMALFVKRLTGWRGLPVGNDGMDAIEF